MRKRICIIIPFYNAESYLKRCLDSLLSQTEKDWICLLINDGSSDESITVVHDYLKDARFVLVNQKNRGVSSARNTGIKAALDRDVETIMFIDADDWIDNDYLEKMYSLWKKHGVDIATSIFTHDGDNYSFPNAFPHVHGQQLLSGFEATKTIVEDRILMSHSPTKIYAKSLWQEIRYPEGVSYMEDQATVFKAFAEAKSVLLTDQLGYHYWEATPNSGSKKPFTPKKVLDGLFGYFASFGYEYKHFTKCECESIHFASSQALARAYLTLLPRYISKEAKPNEKEIFKSYQRIIRQEKIIQRFEPKTHKETIKKRVYLLSKKLYVLTFRYRNRKQLNAG